MELERAAPDDPKWAEHSASHMSRYLLAADHVRGRRVLDAGAGNGYGGQLLLTLGAAEVVAVDIDAESMDAARRKYGSNRLTYVADDCQELSKESGPFDVICSFELLEHLREPARFLRRTAQLLAPGGVMLLSTPDRLGSQPFINGKPRNPFHLHEWYQAEFREMVSEYFDDVELRAQVQSAAHHARKEAVAALRKGLLWANPLTTFFWRKMPFVKKAQRPWKKLAGLSIPTVADYPVVPLAVAGLYGTPYGHFAICRGPRT